MRNWTTKSLRTTRKLTSQGADEPDPPGADIRDMPEASDEWLLKTKPLQGARPRWNKDGRPPVILNQMGVIDIKAAGGAVGQNVKQRGTPTPLLPLEQRIMQEKEVRTPPRREAHGHGSHQVAEHQLPPGGTRVVPQIFTDVRTRDVGPDRRNDAWSPRNVLVDTVAWM